MTVVGHTREEVWAAASAALVGVILLAPLAASDGGYFPTAWGWSALACACTAALLLLLGEERSLSRLELVALAGLAGLFVWVLLSNLWTTSVTRTMLDGERVLVYVTGLALVLLLVRRAWYGALLGGIWAAVLLVSGYALATRLFPNRLGVVDDIARYRLSEPIGYWNALAVFAGIGVLLALGLAARGSYTVVRVASAASLPLLVVTLYFTFSRGAWLALGAGVLFAVALDPRRLNLVTSLLVFAPLPALGVWLASRSEPLTREGFSTSDVADDGRRLTVILLALALASAVTAAVFSLTERRLRPSRRVQLAYAGALVLVVLSGLIGIFATYGGPVALVEKGYGRFTSSGPHQDEGLQARLFSLSGGERDLLWGVAWDQYRGHPLLGTGAGTFEEHWVRERPILKGAREAFGLYIETLAELGPVGLGLLLTALLPPLLAAVRVRNLALVPPAAGAYVTFLVHAAGDWDWELAGVSLTALYVGAALLIAARSHGTLTPVFGRLRTAAIALAVTLGAFAFVVAIRASALAEAQEAADRGDLITVLDETQRARRLAPWSSEPWEIRGRAQLQAGQLVAARRSLREALDRDERNWVLWYYLAVASTGPERASAIARAAELNPQSDLIRNLRDSPSGS